MEKENPPLEEVEPEQERIMRAQAEAEKQEEEILTLEEELPKKKPVKKSGEPASVFKVEDLFG